jgi:hypothetical protein
MQLLVVMVTFKPAFMNRLAVLIPHLLKWQSQPEILSNGWRYSIRERRAGVLDLIEDSRSLSGDVEHKLKKAHSKALIIGAKETDFE